MSDHLTATKYIDRDGRHVILQITSRPLRNRYIFSHILPAGWSVHLPNVSSLNVNFAGACAILLRVSVHALYSAPLSVGLLTNALLLIGFAQLTIVTETETASEIDKYHK